MPVMALAGCQKTLVDCLINKYAGCPILEGIRRFWETHETHPPLLTPNSCQAARAPLSGANMLQRLDFRATGAACIVNPALYLTFNFEPVLCSMSSRFQATPA